MSEKLQKVLSRAGLGSRREIETWIADNRVKVNGVIARVGDRVTATDRIHVDGHPVSIAKERTHVLLYNKPIDQICTRHDPEGRETVFSALPELPQGRWVSIGRLDINTSGLLLFTNDGELANKLMHPSSEIEREYLVRVLGELDDAVCQRLMTGVRLDDGMARFVSITYQGGRGANHWYRVVLKEGRYREVRRLFESQSLTVSRLKRIRFGEIVLPESLPAGRYIELTSREVSLLKNG